MGWRIVKNIRGRFEVEYAIFGINTGVCLLDNPDYAAEFRSIEEAKMALANYKARKSEVGVVWEERK